MESISILKKYCKAFFSWRSHKAPRIVKRDAHHLSRRSVSKNALKVLYHLKKNGFEAYLVGGGVRDILLHTTPKDFDIATDARPEQIKRIFYNCLLIGKRFRIAHIRFSGEIIEVTTFRAASVKGDMRLLSPTGMLLRDNVYGSIHEDVWRRDFSINALYYNIKDFSIVDYCGALEDMEKKQIRIIGDPVKRYREDPVRLLRAIRLAAKFPAFHLERHTEKALIQQASSLSEVSNSRLFEEVLKLFHGGYAVASYELLQHYQLFEQLFPNVQRTLQDSSYQCWIKNALIHTDKRYHTQQKLSSAFLFAVLLWPALVKELAALQEKSLPTTIAYTQAIKSVLCAQQRSTSLTRFCSHAIQDIWLLQVGLIKRQPSQTKRLLSHPRFRAAYDFLLLRVEIEELPDTLGKWWTTRAEKHVLTE